MAARPVRAGIVVRTLDRPYFLERALRDVLAQELTEWEIVIANDGGDLAAVNAVVDRLASELGDRVRILDVERPGGRCAAANQGLQATTAPYVVLHDDDDMWEPTFLAETVAWLDAHPDDGGVMVPTEIVYERERGGQYVETRRAPFWAGLSQITYLDLLSVNRAVPISFLYRRELHDELGWYDETLEAVEDWEFYLRITVEHHIGFLRGRPLAFWTQRPKARGVSANSMYALGDVHRRDETLVRDRAIRAYVRQYGAGMPHLVAGLVQAQLLEAERLRYRRSLRGFVERIRARLARG